MTCIIVAAIVTCTGTAPKVTPAQAAAILAPGQFVYTAPVPRRLPERDSPSSPTAGPFGEFRDLHYRTAEVYPLRLNRFALRDDRTWVQGYARNQGWPHQPAHRPGR